MRLHAEDVWLHVAPMFHLVDAFAIYAVTAVGGRHVIMPTFAAAETLRVIERERVSVTNMASTMALLCVNNPLAGVVDTSSVRVMSCGGSPLPAAAVRRAVAVLGTEFFMSYGMTESWCAASMRASVHAAWSERVHTPGTQRQDLDEHPDRGGAAAAAGGAAGAGAWLCAAL